MSGPAGGGAADEEVTAKVWIYVKAATKIAAGAMADTGHAAAILYMGTTL